MSLVVDKILGDVLMHDHTDYPLLDGSRAFTGNQSFGDNDITNVGDIALDSISSDDGTSINVNLGTDAGDDFIIDTDTLVVEGDTGHVGLGNTDPSALLEAQFPAPTTTPTVILHSGRNAGDISKNQNIIEYRPLDTTTVIGSVDYLGRWTINPTGSGTTTANVDASMIVNSRATNIPSAVITGTGSQSADLLRFYRSGASTIRAKFDYIGRMTLRPAGSGIDQSSSDTTAIIHPRTTGASVLALIGLAGQTGDMFQIRSNGASDGDLFVVESDGKTGINNASPGAQLEVDTTSASTIGTIIKASASQTANLLEFQDSSGNILERTNKDGVRIIKNTSAIADGDLNASEMAFWLDDSNGAGKMEIKAKTADGTVVTGSVALS